MIGDIDVVRSYTYRSGPMWDWFKMEKLKASMFSFLVVGMIPYFHIGLVHMKFWVPWKKPVNRAGCTCDCFDTIFKGSYETPGKVGYKHMYFNSTPQTFFIWLGTLVAVISLYELLKSLWNIFQSGHMRWSMTFLLVMDIYPHYYTWWSYFNYLNDDFYSQFRHQLFFSITELFSTVLIFSICSLEKEIVSWKILSIICISVIHILVGGIDQFFVQFFLGEGAMFQRARNAGFLIPDFLHICIPLFVQWKIHKAKNTDFCNMYTRRELTCFTAAVLIGFLMGKLILS